MMNWFYYINRTGCLSLNTHTSTITIWWISLSLLDWEAAPFSALVCLLYVSLYAMKHGPLTLQSSHKAEDTQTLTSYKLWPAEKIGLWQKYSLQKDFFPRQWIENRIRIPQSRVITTLLCHLKYKHFESVFSSKNEDSPV